MGSNPSSIDRLLTRLRGASVMRSDPSMYGPQSGAESVMDMNAGIVQQRAALTSSGRMQLGLTSAARSATALSDQAPAGNSSGPSGEAAAHPSARGQSPFINAQLPPSSEDEDEAVVDGRGHGLSAVLETGMTSGTMLRGVSMRSAQLSSGNVSLESAPAPLRGMGVQQLARAVRETIALGEQEMAAARDMAQLFVVQREDLQPM